MNLKNSRCGFSLIEILVSVVIFSSVMLMTAGSLNMGVKIKNKVDAILQVQDETRSLAEYLSREIQSADNGDYFQNQFTSCSIDGISKCGASLILKNTDQISGKTTEKTFLPSIDGKDLVEKVLSSDGSVSVQVLNSQKVRLVDLRFYRQIDSSYVNVKMVFEENNSVPKSAQKVSLADSFLGKPVRFELQFTAMVNGS